MYHTNQAEKRSEPRHGPPGTPGYAPSLGAPQNGAGRTGQRLRVVRAPGGFAFVEDRRA